jgi:hypothetical protein
MNGMQQSYHGLERLYLIDDSHDGGETPSGAIPISQMVFPWAAIGRILLRVKSDSSVNLGSEINNLRVRQLSPEIKDKRTEVNFLGMLESKN